MEDNKIRTVDCNRELERIGSEIKTPVIAIAVGGYCLIRNGIMDSDLPTRFTPMVPEFAIQEKFLGEVKSDMFVIGSLDLDFMKMKRYSSRELIFENLTVLLADDEFLLALKWIAMQANPNERNCDYYNSLVSVCDKKETYIMLCSLGKMTIGFEEFCKELECEDSSKEEEPVYAKSKETAKQRLKAILNK